MIDLPCAAGHRDCWKWLQGDFKLVTIVDELCNAMTRDKWQGWLANDDSKVNLMNQLVAHCVCRVPITRQQLVPGGGAAGATVTWQDLENDGLAYIGEPGMQPGPLAFAPWPLLSGVLLIYICFTLDLHLQTQMPSCILQCWRLGLTLQLFARYHAQS